MHHSTESVATAIPNQRIRIRHRAGTIRIAVRDGGTADPIRAARTGRSRPRTGTPGHRGQGAGQSPAQHRRAVRHIGSRVADAGRDLGEARDTRNREAAKTADARRRDRRGEHGGLDGEEGLRPTGRNVLGNAVRAIADKATGRTKLVHHRAGLCRTDGIQAERSKISAGCDAGERKVSASRKDANLSRDGKDLGSGSCHRGDPDACQQN